MKKRVLISQPWPTSAVPHLNNFIAELEAKECEVVLYPETSRMRASDLIDWLPGFCAHICGSDEWTAEAMGRARGDSPGDLTHRRRL